MATRKNVKKGTRKTVGRRKRHIGAGGKTIRSRVFNIFANTRRALSNAKGDKQLSTTRDNTNELYNAYPDKSDIKEINTNRDKLEHIIDKKILEKLQAEAKTEAEAESQRKAELLATAEHLHFGKTHTTTNKPFSQKQKSVLNTPSYEMAKLLHDITIRTQLAKKYKDHIMEELTNISKGTVKGRKILSEIKENNSKLSKNNSRNNIETELAELKSLMTYTPI